MKAKYGHSLKRTLAFVAELTILTSSAIVTSFATEKSENTAAVGTVTKHVDDYTKYFPGLRDMKMKLSDPVFSEKDWYEYIEYEFYTEVKDGDMTYRIYQPTDYSAASIMAITDYDPKEAVSSSSNITMNLGELQGILDLAAQGGSISKDYAGLNLATGIASQMNSINEVMDNSKYYSTSSFLGIPGDKKYTGVSNDGFFTNDELTITISITELVSACKTVALDSSYSISESDMSGSERSSYNEANEVVGITHQDEVHVDNAQTAGQAVSHSTSESQEISQSVSDMLAWEISDTLTTTLGFTEGLKVGFEEGVSAKGSVGVGEAEASFKSTQEAYFESHQEISNALQISQSGSQTFESGMSKSIGSEQSVSQNLEVTNSQGKSSSDTTAIEHGLTSGQGQGVTREHSKDVAVDLGYGVDYSYGSQTEHEVAVERKFAKRDDKEVKNVGWKLCEYVVKIPYYIEAVKTDSTGEEKVLYGQYVNYNLLNGVSRVFANGYIEHWYTGELVTYADFFDGFITATELVDKAKEQQAAKVPKEGE